MSKSEIIKAAVGVGIGVILILSFMPSLQVHDSSGNLPPPLNPSFNYIYVIVLIIIVAMIILVVINEYYKRKDLKTNKGLG